MDIQEQKNIALSYINPSLLLKGIIGVVLFYCCIFVYGIFENATVLQAKSETELDSTIVKVSPNYSQDDYAQRQDHASLDHDNQQITLEAEIYNPSQAVEELDSHSSEAAHNEMLSQENQQKRLSNEELEAALYGPSPVTKWIPQKGPFNETVFETYAYDNKFPIYNNDADIKGKISLIFIEVGTTNDALLDDALNALPPVFSIAWYPYAKNITERAKKSYLKGFENWSSLLLQPDNYPLSDLGVLALDKDMELKDAAQLVASKTMNVPYSIGFVSAQKTNFFSNRQSISNINKILSALGMGYINAQSNLSMQRSFVDSLAYAEADLVVDDVANAMSIKANLSNLEKIARESGYAIGYVHLYPKTLAALKEWVPSIQNKGLQLVSTSSLLKGNFQ